MSRVRKAVKAAIEAQQGPNMDYTKKFTLRLGPVEFYKLHKVAEAMAASKTGCAETLLNEAVEEAWEAAGLIWDQEDAGEFFSQLTSEVEQRTMNERLARELQGQHLVEGQAA